MPARLIVKDLSEQDIAVPVYPSNHQILLVTLQAVVDMPFKNFKEILGSELKLQLLFAPTHSLWSPFYIPSSEDSLR